MDLYYDFCSFYLVGRSCHGLVFDHRISDRLFYSDAFSEYPRHMAFSCHHTVLGQSVDSYGFDEIPDSGYRAIESVFDVERLD